MCRSLLGLATKEQRPNLHYDIEEPGTARTFEPDPSTGWRYSKDRMLELIIDGSVLFPRKDVHTAEQAVAAKFLEKLGRPKLVSELTKERLRRAGKEAWNPNPDDLQTTVEEHTEHLVHGRSEQDILYELLLKLGLDLAVHIETRQIAGTTVHNIGAGALMVCLSDGIDRDVAEPLALGIALWQKAQADALQAGGGDKNKPVGTKLVFKDGAFADDLAKTNLAAILSQHGLDDVRSI